MYLISVDSHSMEKDSIIVKEANGLLWHFNATITLVCIMYILNKCWPELKTAQFYV